MANLRDILEVTAGNSGLAAKKKDSFFGSRRRPRRENCHYKANRFYKFNYHF